jgi:hypothetical protein
MKNYIVADYQNWDDLQADLTTELNGLVNLPIEVEHVKYGKGVITSLTVRESSAPSGTSFHIMGNIDFYFDNPRTFAIDIGINSKQLFVAEPENSTIINFAADLQTLYLEVETERTARYRAECEAKKQAEEAARQEAKLQARMEKGVQDFNDMKNERRRLCATGEFYYALGWLANNCNALTAAMPDYILPYFEKQFDTNGYTPSVADSKQLTPAGNPSKYTLSMQIGIAKNSRDLIPAVFFDYLNKERTAITNTSFVWELVDIYGFQFGKTQDVDKIRDSIPTEYLEPFEKGYAE